MANTLDPLIREKLVTFGRRWRSLMLLRGVCCTVITFLGALLLAATMDWLFILPEPVRWTLTACVYVGTLAVAWFFCLKPLFRPMDIRHLARLVEKAAPDLREHLLAAVELGDTDPAAAVRWDSAAFRSLVQAGVVEQLRDLHMESLLPPRLIRIWLRAAAAVVLGCALLSGWGDGRQLFARALAPLANLERVSRTKIAIVEPSPADLLAPLGDTLPVVVHITGPDPEKAFLETQPLGGKFDRVQMSPQGGGQFTAALPVSTASLQYRVRAGDGITRLFTVNSQPRPHVLKFEKKFRFPEYTAQPSTSVTEESGDLKTLEGTEVDLQLHANQPVTEGELRIVEAGATNILRLASVSPQVLAVTVPIKADATYTVHLVAAETSFENKFSPAFEIHPLPDLVPRVSLEAPKDETIVTAEEIVTLAGTAMDDIGLKSVVQMFQVNGSEWTEVPIPIEARTNVSIVQRWDLLKVGVAPGDKLVTKLVATDLKGSRAESSPIRLTVSTSGFDPSRVRGLLAGRVVVNSLEAVRKAAADLTRAVPPEAAQKFTAYDEIQRKQFVGSASAAAEEVDRALDFVAEAVKDALKVARPGRESADLSLVGRVISRIKHERVAPLHAEVENWSAVVGAKIDAASLRRTHTGAAELSAFSTRVTSLVRDLHMAEEGDVLAENLSHLGNEQERLAKQAESEPPDEAMTWDRLQRRETAAAKETAGAEARFKEFQERLPAALGERAGKPLAALTAGRTTLERALALPDPSRKMLASTAEFRRTVAGVVQQFRPLAADLAAAADKARVELAALAGTAAASIAQLRNDADALAAAPKANPAAVAEARETLQRDWQAAVAELKDRARLEESRHDASPQFAADASTAALALNSLRTAAAAANPKDTDAALQRLEQSLRALEAANHLSELDSGLKALARQERWNKGAADSATARPKDAAWLNNELKSTAAELKNAALPEAAVSAVAPSATAAATAAVQQEMAARQASDRAPVPLREPFEKLVAAVQQAQKESAAAINAARTDLATTAPKLSDQLAGLAKTAEDLQQAAAAAQAVVAAQPPAAAVPTNGEPAKLLGQQAELNRQVQDTMEAIRREANVQDFTKAEGRERARDADDAVAMLREPPPKVAESLKQAAAAPDAATRAEALADAVKQEQKLASALQQLAKHFANAEAGKPEETRAGLRKAEEELGIKSALEAQYAQAAKLMDLLSQSPEQMLAQLEQELARNDVMRQELQAIARDTLAPAREALQQAAATEKKLADDLVNAGTRGAETLALAEQSRQLAEKARDMATKELPKMTATGARARAEAGAELARAQQAFKATAEKAPLELAKDPAAAAKQMADLAPALQQASRDLQTAASKSAEAIKTAVQEGEVEAGKTLQAQAEQAAQQATEMAQKAGELAKAIGALPPGTPEQAMVQAAKQQAPLATELTAAAAEMQRAARHESRLGTAQGESLQKVGEGTQAVASEQIPAAQTALANQLDPASAKAAVQEASGALQKQMAALGAALALPAAPKPATDPAASQPSPEQSKWMARALDKLDASMNAQGMPGAEQGTPAPADGKGTPGKPGAPAGEGQGKGTDPGAPPGKGGDGMAAGKQGGDPVGEALGAAAQEQMSAMRAARAGGQLPGENNPTPTGRGDGSGTLQAEGNFDPAALPQLPGMRDVNWAKLPPKLAQGLIESRRESVAAEYRNQVDAYFRAIADRAREKKKP